MSAGPPALLSVECVSKAFPVSTGPRGRAAALLRAVGRRAGDRVAVVQDVSFELQRGEPIGLIGCNGAGKSTLLKLIARVLHPSSGRVHCGGSVGALLELGAGFDPERTGRDNARHCAFLHGLHPRELRRREPGLFAFADLGAHIDVPVKHYSSGMVARLGFAVMTALRPDLLIADEVLAVGDASFQRRCAHWVEQYLRDGGALLLASHSMAQVQRLCRRAIWLHGGSVQAIGDAQDVCTRYLAWHADQAVGTSALVCAEWYAVTRVQLNGSSSSSVVLHAGDDLVVDIVAYSPDGRAPQVAIGVVREDGVPVYGTATDTDAAPSRWLDSHHVGYRIVFEALPLLPGRYRLRLHAEDPEGLRLFDTVERSLLIPGKTRDLGLVRLRRRWES